jgi:short-subunit dehydrogenase
MMEIRGKGVLITGASSGIGRALALAFAARGARVVMAARRARRLRETAAEIHRLFPQAPGPSAILCDVSDRKSVRRLIEEAARLLGGIDILVNNAGIGVYGNTWNTAVSDIQSILSVNFYGAINGIMEVLPHMHKERSGLIVNIASVASKHGMPYLGAYGASKAALAVFSQSLRAELAGTGISILVVYPGYTETEFFSKEKHVGGGRRPQGPYAPPSRVADAVIRAIERGKPELVLTLSGRLLTLIQGLLPGLAAKAMAMMAGRLKGRKEYSNEQTKITDHSPFPKPR